MRLRQSRGRRGETARQSQQNRQIDLETPEHLADMQSNDGKTLPDVPHEHLSQNPYRCHSLAGRLISDSAGRGTKPGKLLLAP